MARGTVAINGRRLTAGKTAFFTTEAQSTQSFAHPAPPPFSKKLCDLCASVVIFAEPTAQSGPTEETMSAPILAGAAYFAIVFAAGFVLGTIRVLLIVPAIGELRAVTLELPLILGWSWLATGWLIRRFTVPKATKARLTMGGVAFALLMAAEIATFTLTQNQPPTAWPRQFLQPAQTLGLLGQIAFALLPLIR